MIPALKVKLLSLSTYQVPTLVNILGRPYWIRLSDSQKILSLYGNENEVDQFSKENSITVMCYLSWVVENNL